MKRQRRDFLKLSGSLVVSQLLSSPFIEKSFAAANLTHSQLNNWVLVTYGKTHKNISSPSNPKGAGKLIAYNLDTKERIEIQTNFFGHELVSHPLQQNLAFSCLKKGNLASLVDFKTKKIVHQVRAPEDIQFYGHAVWSKDGNNLYVTAQNEKLDEGIVLVYDTQTMKIENQYKSGGNRPHQLQFKNENEIIVLNQFDSETPSQMAKVSSFSTIRASDGKVVQKQKLSRSTFTHFVYDSNKKSYFVGGYLDEIADVKTDCILDILHDGKTAMTDVPSLTKIKPQGELLSIKISNLNPSLVAFTVSESGYIVLYDLDKKKFLLTDHSVEITKGLFFSLIDPDILYVNDKDKNLHTFKIVKSGYGWRLKRIDEVKMLGNGSHLNISQWV